MSKVHINQIGANSIMCYKNHKDLIVCKIHSVNCENKTVDLLCVNSYCEINQINGVELNKLIPIVATKEIIEKIGCTIHERKKYPLYFGHPQIPVLELNSDIIRIQYLIMRNLYFEILQIEDGVLNPLGYPLCVHNIQNILIEKTINNYHFDQDFLSYLVKANNLRYDDIKM